MYDVTKENVVGIGKVKIYPTAKRLVEIPVLHYIVIKESDSSYSAICIELRLDANCQTVSQAREELIDTINEFIEQTFEHAPSAEQAYESLIALYTLNEDSVNEWNVYRTCQLLLAMRGIKTDIVTELENEIKVLKKKIIDLESAQKFVEQQRSFSDEFIEVSAA